MNEQKRNDQPEDDDREAELRKLIEDMSPQQAAEALAGLASGLSLQADKAWLKNMGPGMRQMGDLDSRPFDAPIGALELQSAAKSLEENYQARQEAIKNCTEPLQLLIYFRDDVYNMSYALGYGDLHGHVIGKFYQTLCNLILWYGQWEKNRDYSSAINASMALGKLSIATNMLQKFDSRDLRPTPSNLYPERIERITKICEQCWDRISKAAGRIVPFEKE